MANRVFDKVKEFFIDTDDLQEEKLSPDDVMTDGEKKLGQYFIEELRMRKADMSDETAEWDAQQEVYECERRQTNPDPKYPCSFVALVTPIVEGQVASMTESSLEFTCHTRIPGLEPYMQMLDAAGDYVRNINMYSKQFKDFTRNYEIYGNAICRVSWQESTYNSKTRPDGFPKIHIPDISKVYIDGKISDYKDLQQAEYIIENMGVHSIGWAKAEYGEERANAISVGVGLEDEEYNFDTMQAFVLYHVWTRKNEQHNLQLIEMDGNGFVLRASDPAKGPYYKKTFNQYPYYMARMMPKRGSIYGFGDGRLLFKSQELINKLSDEIELAARHSSQSKLAVDPRGKARMSQFNSDPSKPILIENPNNTIRVLEARGINVVVFNYIEFLLREAQRMTRFHDIMTGNMKGSSATATQVNVQSQQGNVGINDKKADISQAMEWAYRYCLQLCLENWSVPMWGMVGKENIWVDFNKMSKVANPIPVSAKTVEEFASIGKKPPKYQFMRSGKKGTIKEDMDFDVTVVIGQGLAKGRIDLYNMIINLLQIAPPNKDGVAEPLMSRDQAKKYLEDVTGMKFDDEIDEANDTELNNLKAEIERLTQQINPVTGNGVQTPQGSQIGALQNNLASTAVGAGASDKRGMI